MTDPRRMRLYALRNWVMVLFATTALGACKATTNSMQAATISNLTPDQRAELQRVVADSIGQENIRISPTVFAGSHILVLEPVMRRTPQGTLATGTTITRPPTFHLLGNGRRCELHDLTNDIRHALSFACGARQPHTKPP